jgi:type I restriction enzyme, S subunit
MELKAGYKRTEIGAIPDEWNVASIEEIATVRSGKRLPLGKTLSDSSTSHPYIRVIDMFMGGVYLGDIKYVPDDVFPFIKNYRIFKDDVFISVAGTLGIVGKIPAVLDGANLTENANKLTDLKCDQNFLLYVLMSRIVQGVVESERTLGAQPKLALTRIRKFLIPLPPLPEQQAIADALSDVDVLIGELDALIAKKRNIKQGAMQELLTSKTRLVGFSGEWKTKRLGDLGKFRGGNGFPIKYQGGVEGDYPFFKVSDMNNEGNSTFMVNSNNWISETIRKEIGSNIFPKHSVVFAKIGAAIFLERKKILSRESCIDNNMMGFVLDENVAFYKFIHYLFMSIQLGRLVSTTALPALSGKEIAELTFGIPAFEEQHAIAEVLSDMDAEIKGLERKRAKFQAVKQGMMQELLTGKTRLVGAL